jgi:uncharacterized tellurite resistance protein B-like protein/predicted RNA-binding Zn-ribbon protein involved in translation (DUF1610 family)
MFFLLPHRRTALLLGIATVSLLGISAADFAFGQAGGGGGYGGGGGGYGGGGGGYGGGGGGGDGDGLVILIWFTFKYPYIAIPLWIMLGLIFYLGKVKERDVRVTRTIRKGRKAQEAILRSNELEKISTSDPQFDEHRFLSLVEHAFITTQYAWSEQDLQPSRPFISDGIHERFQLYISMQKAENKRNRMKNVQIRSREIVYVNCEQAFNTIHVRFVASAISYDEDLDTRKRVGGNSDQYPITFTEVWSFSRRPGVQTNPESSVLEGNCPNCGGPLEIVDKSQCPFCESIVNSGQHDWVLAEITQDSEWIIPTANAEIPGWPALKSGDPGLNFQHIEDRGSVIFWRCLMAVYFEDFSYAAPVLSHTWHDVPKHWKLPAGQFWRGPAVGVVEVNHAQPATDDDPFDRIHVMVRWSARPAEGNRRNPRNLGQQKIYTHLLILKRKVGVKSRIEQTFSSFSCTSCGSPINVGGKSVCDFCGAALNDGSLDWVLEDVKIRTFGDIQTTDSTSESKEPVRLENERLTNAPELLGAMVRMMAVDGELHAKEKEQLTRLALRRGFNQERLTQVFNAALTNDAPIALPTEPRVSRAFMDHLIRMALADGTLTKEEKTLIMQLGQQVGWIAADVKVAIARNRNALYRQAQEALRQQKKNQAKKNI